MTLFITNLQFQNLFVQFYGFYVFDQRAVVENSVSGETSFSEEKETSCMNVIQSPWKIKVCLENSK